jgi:hypothetical protein
MPMNGYPYPGQPAPFQYPSPWTQQPQAPPMPAGSGMPGMPQPPAPPAGPPMPQMAPPPAPQMAPPPMPQMAPQSGMTQMPTIPSSPPVPKVGQLPPRANTNATGGAAQGAQSALRSGVHTQLYRLGKQMDGKPSMFGQFDPNAMAPQPDPLAWMQPQPEPQPQVMPQLPPAPMGPTPDQYPPHLRPVQQTPPRPIDRFPALAARMGRPALPAPNGQRY